MRLLSKLPLLQSSKGQPGGINHIGHAAAATQPKHAAADRRDALPLVADAAGSDGRVRAGVGEPLKVQPARVGQAGIGTISAGAVTAQPLIGFSDITALHQWRQTQGFVSIHGPVLTQLGRLGRATSERLFSLLESDAPAKPLHGTTVFVEGIAEGPLLGGNLSVFTRLLGTPFMPDLEGAILLLEDVGERPYRLDRMWMHLELAGVFRKVRGIALGSFTHCEERDATYTSQDVLRELAVATGLPCAIGFPIGHGDVNEPVPLGVRVRLDATTAQLTFLEAAVSEQ
jgi:muramoyltetrapeptide carboxypeptidase LdcA involved in peptidoglycan recycling